MVSNIMSTLWSHLGNANQMLNEKLRQKKAKRESGPEKGESGPEEVEH